MRFKFLDRYQNINATTVRKTLLEGNYALFQTLNVCASIDSIANRIHCNGSRWKLITMDTFGLYVSGFILSKNFLDHLLVCDVRKGHLKARSALHLTLDRVHGALITCPAAACDTVVHVPKEHVLDVAV